MSESAIHFGHRVGTNDKDRIMTAAKTVLGGQLICLCQIMVIFFISKGSVICALFL